MGERRCKSSWSRSWLRSWPWRRPSRRPRPAAAAVAARRGLEWKQPFRNFRRVDGRVDGHSGYLEWRRDHGAGRPDRSTTSPSASPSGTSSDFTKYTTQADCQRAGGMWQVAQNACTKK